LSKADAGRQQLPQSPGDRAGRSKSFEHRHDAGLDSCVGIARAAPIDQMHQTNRQTQGQFAAPCLVEDPAAQTAPQQMQLSFAHGAFQAEQQTIIEGGRIIDTLLIKDQRVRVSAKLQQLLPVDRIARQAGHFEPEHNADLAKSHCGDQLLEPITSRAVRPRRSEILIDHMDAISRPAER